MMLIYLSEGPAANVRDQWKRQNVTNARYNLPFCRCHTSSQWCHRLRVRPPSTFCKHRRPPWWELHSSVTSSSSPPQGLRPPTSQELASPSFCDLVGTTSCRPTAALSRGDRGVCSRPSLQGTSSPSSQERWLALGQPPSPRWHPAPTQVCSLVSSSNSSSSNRLSNNSSSITPIRQQCLRRGTRLRLHIHLTGTTLGCCPGQVFCRLHTTCTQDPQATLHQPSSRWLLPRLHLT